MVVVVCAHEMVSFVLSSSTLELMSVPCIIASLQELIKLSVIIIIVIMLLIDAHVVVHGFSWKVRC